jgi:hypothetical protein
LMLMMVCAHTPCTAGRASTKLVWEYHKSGHVRPASALVTECDIRGFKPFIFSTVRNLPLDSFLLSAASVTAGGGGA